MLKVKVKLVALVVMDHEWDDLSRCCSGSPMQNIHKKCMGGMKNIATAVTIRTRIMQKVEAT